MPAVKSLARFVAEIRWYSLQNLVKYEKFARAKLAHSVVRNHFPATHYDQTCGLHLSDLRSRRLEVRILSGILCLARRKLFRNNSFCAYLWATSDVAPTRAKPALGADRDKAVQSSANCLTPWRSPPRFLSTTVITICAASRAGQNRSGSTASLPEKRAACRVHRWRSSRASAIGTYGSRPCLAPVENSDVSDLPQVGRTNADCKRMSDQSDSGHVRRERSDAGRLYLIAQRCTHEDVPGSREPTQDIFGSESRLSRLRSPQLTTFVLGVRSPSMASPHPCRAVALNTSR
jgi:hypothetical protein